MWQVGRKVTKLLARDCWGSDGAKCPTHGGRLMFQTATDWHPASLVVSGCLEMAGQLHHLFLPPLHITGHKLHRALGQQTGIQSITLPWCEKGRRNKKVNKWTMKKWIKEWMKKWMSEQNYTYMMLRQCFLAPETTVFSLLTGNSRN